MKKTRKFGGRLLALVLALAILAGSGITLIATGVWEPLSWFADGDSTPEYDKPSLNEVAQEGIVPDPMEPAADDISSDKPWYEYITYDTESIGEYVSKSGKKGASVKYVYYDPYDYNYGLTMEIDDTNVAHMDNIGWDIDMPCPFSSANEVSVTWSTSKTREFSEEVSVGAEVSYGVETGAFGITASTEISAQLGFAFTAVQANEKGVEQTQTFSAVHFNSNGVPYQWKVVHYTVYLPLKVEIYKQDSQGNYVLENTTYCTIPTVEGTCREYIINGVVYIEDWRTGDGIPLDDFWDDFMTEDKLKKAYEGKLLPTNS